MGQNFRPQANNQCTYLNHRAKPPPLSITDMATLGKLSNFLHVKNSLFCSNLLNNRRLLGFFVHTIFKAEVYAPTHNTFSLLSLQLNLL